jgi:DMSO/TMAO reductase YedYZ molybdopterin-dependent catalytic subunit
MKFSRREWFQLLGSAPLLSAGSVTLSQSPKISVQDFEQYPRLLTPTEDFFVRNHFATPQTVSDPWRIRVSGAVTREAAFTIAELRERKQRTVTALLECAGNGVGVGAVGCAEWAGATLSDLLAGCGVASEARFVRLIGADRGTEPDAGREDFAYSRVIPLRAAMSADALLALDMNGAPLPPDHGSPVRFLLPGSYGMNSVKWLREIELLQNPGDDFYVTHRFRRVANDKVLDPVNEIAVKSIIVQPKPNAAMRGSALSVGGYAWGGEGIARVEVSVNEGGFRPAVLMGPSTRYAWRPWKFDTGPLRAGNHTVAARAFAVSGLTQPAARDPKRQDQYELNDYHRLRFMLRP